MKYASASHVAKAATSQQDPYNKSTIKERETEFEIKVTLHYFDYFFVFNTYNYANASILTFILLYLTISIQLETLPTIISDKSKTNLKLGSQL